MPPQQKAKDPLINLLAGGAAGLVESTTCHPLDTIKTRMQLRSSARASVDYKGPWRTAVGIVGKDGPLALYKGLTAVMTGIVPKMAIRFFSFESYKDLMGQTPEKPLSKPLTFLAGLGAGVTEAVLIVTPFEVCKIRLQGQYSSMADPIDPKNVKYRNVAQTLMTVAREEGVGALWKGVYPTLMRQGINQAVNFTAYQSFKTTWADYQGQELASWQHFLCGGFSGALGPMANCPLDVVKTRLQKQVIQPGIAPKYTGILQAIPLIAKEEGVLALWKGLEPRLMRIVPGQAITFAVYERAAALLIKMRDE